MLLVFIIPMLFIILILPYQALAWGSVTHNAICRAAGGGDEFALGGVAPDMIALYSVTTGDASFDYTHNYYGAGREPVFGDLMVEVQDTSFSRGWAAHQLADSVVHGVDGYSNRKQVFRDIPEQYKTTLSHGAVELIVDAIVLDEVFGGQVELSVPERSELIHETTVRFYNEALPAGKRIPRSTIINCHTAANLAFRWDLCLNTNKYLASLLIDEPWFASVRREFADFRPLFSKSVSLVGGRLADATNPASPVAVVIPVGCNDSVWDGLAALLPVGIVLAADGSSQQGGEGTGEPTDYYRYLNRLSIRASQIGQGRIDKESVRKAAAELAAENSLPDEERAWAIAAAGLTDKHTTDLRQVSQSIREAGRRSSGKGAAGGLMDDVLPYFPCATALAVLLGALAWLFKR